MIRPLSLFFILVLSLATATGLSSAESSLKSLLISIEKYETAPLEFAEKDVAKLATILMTRYDCQTYAYIDSAGESPRESIMERIKDWCASLGNDDTAILYLAGHGVKDADGKLYLAMIDFNSRNFETAAIPLTWIRERFEESAATKKLILVDTCFAGESKSADFEQASTEEVGETFSKGGKTVVLASSRADEKSWLWGEAKHSLFTFWLIEGLKGHADKDDDRIITLGELTEYVQEQVSWIAQSSLGKEQRPMALNAETGAELRFPLRAVQLSQLIEDVAEQIDIQMQVGKQSLVAVSEFTTGSENSFEREYGNLPKWVADSLRRSLTTKARKNRRPYKVATENTTLELFRSQGLSPDDIGTEKTANLKIQGRTVPALVTGRLTFIGDAGISLRVQLVDAEQRTEVTQAGGTATLNAKEMALAGVSGKFAIVDRKPEPASRPAPPPQPESPAAPEHPTGPRRYHSDPVVGLVSREEQQEMEQVRRERTQPHPSADRQFLFRTTIEVRPAGKNRQYEERNLVFIGNDCYLSVSKGEEFQFRVYNGSNELVFARILVDGLNTLSQRMRTTQSKGAFVEAVDDPEGEYEVAPRVSLEDARPWVLAPKVNYSPIAGFVDANGKAETMQLFRIVDADQSVAARKNYTDQIGLITIGIFRAEKDDPGQRRFNPGIGPGAIIKVNVPKYEGDFVPGEMIAAWNIRYVTPEMLQSLQNEAKAKRK